MNVFVMVNTDFLDNGTPQFTPLRYRQRIIHTFKIHFQKVSQLRYILDGSGILCIYFLKLHQQFFSIKFELVHCYEVVQI